MIDSRLLVDWLEIVVEVQALVNLFAFGVVAVCVYQMRGMARELKDKRL